MRAEFRQDLVIFVIMASAMILGASSCTQKPLTAPTSSAVEGGFHNIESHVSIAQSQNSDIVKETATARTKLERVQDKEILAIRYREYRAKHPRPTPTP